MGVKQPYPCIILKNALPCKGCRAERLHFVVEPSENSGKKEHETQTKGRGLSAAAQIQRFFYNPALAVWARLKPARNGRWVASTTLYCYQRPTNLKGGREACKPRREGASRLRDVGLKEPITHRAGKSTKGVIRRPLPGRSAP